MNIKKTPPQSENQLVKAQRSSNFELYRILCMLMILSHHYVVNSGLVSAGGLLVTDYSSNNSIFLSLFGSWGKTGINCFLMITGYFMCTSKITVRKFFKLMGQIYLYRLILYPIFLIAGYEIHSFQRILSQLLPVWGLDCDHFVNCFIVFWLTIPFLNILVQNMTKRQHELLLLLSLSMYTILGSVPTFNIPINYVTWFGLIYFISSYIRLYPHPIFERKALWRLMTIISLVLAAVSILALRFIFGARIGNGYYFVADSNKIFAVAIALSSFLWFKNLNIGYSKLINSLGAGTFGVLLIHANLGASKWLWKDVFDVAGHYTMPLWYLVLYSCGVVLLVFIICNIIDQVRIATIEKWFLKWYDKNIAPKADIIVNKVLN